VAEKMLIDAASLVGYLNADGFLEFLMQPAVSKAPHGDIRYGRP
jgi:hypothetical protein